MLFRTASISFACDADGMTYELPFFSSRDNLRCLETEGNTASYAYKYKYDLLW